MPQIELLSLASLFFSVSFTSSVIKSEANSIFEESGYYPVERFTTVSNSIYYINQQKSENYKLESLTPYYLSSEYLSTKNNLPEKGPYSFGLKLSGPKPRHVVKSLVAGL